MSWTAARRASALAVSLATAAATAAAAPPDDARILIARVATRDEALHAYTARLAVHARSLTFPWGSVTVHGRLRYEAPATYTYELDDVPVYARGLKHLDDAMTKPLTWTRCRMRAAGRATFAGHEVAVVDVAPDAETADVERIEAQVDPAHDHLDRVTYTFADGTIVVDYTYTTFEGHEVVGRERAQIHRGRTHAAIDVETDGYTRA